MSEVIVELILNSPKILSFDLIYEFLETYLFANIRIVKTISTSLKSNMYKTVVYISGNICKKIKY